MLTQPTLVILMLVFMGIKNDIKRSKEARQKKQ